MNLYGLTENDLRLLKSMADAYRGTVRAPVSDARDGRVTNRYPQHRIGEVTEAVTAASYAAGVIQTLGTGKMKFFKAESDGSGVGQTENEEYSVLNLSTATAEVGETLLAIRAQDLQNSGKAEPGWYVNPTFVRSTNEIAYIQVGVSTSNPSAQSVTAGNTLEIEWADDFTVNTDTSIFTQTGAGPPGYAEIQVAVDGYYCARYKLYFTDDSTDASAEIVKGTTTIVRDRGGADTTFDNGEDVLDIWVDKTLGVLRMKAVGEGAALLQADDKIRIDLTQSTGNRGIAITGGEFSVTLLKRT